MYCGLRAVQWSPSGMKVWRPVGQLSGWPCISLWRVEHLIKQRASLSAEVSVCCIYPLHRSQVLSRNILSTVSNISHCLCIHWWRHADVHWWRHFGMHWWRHHHTLRKLQTILPACLVPGSVVCVSPSCLHITLLIHRPTYTLETWHVFFYLGIYHKIHWRTFLNHKHGRGTIWGGGFLK